MSTITAITQGNEFKSKTNTVTLPNGQTLTRTVNYAKQSCFTANEFAKITTNLSVAGNTITYLKSKGIQVDANYRVAKNHANKILRLIWEKAPNKSVDTYKPRVGFTQAIKTILGVTTCKSSYTLAELKKFEGGLVNQMFTKVAAKPKLKLPVINGYEGSINGGNVIYGCAQLPISWFKTPNGGNRTLRSMVLSSGISISSTQMDSIEAYMKENKI